VTTTVDDDALSLTTQPPSQLSPPATTTPMPTPMPERAMNPFQMEGEPKQQQVAVVWALGHVFFCLFILFIS
jgi:hypothetical protein